MSQTPSQSPISIETQFNHTRGAGGKRLIGRGDNLGRDDDELERRRKVHIII